MTETTVLKEIGEHYLLTCGKKTKRISSLPWSVH